MSFSLSSAKSLRHLLSIPDKYILTGLMPAHYIFFPVHYNMLEIYFAW